MKLTPAIGNKRPEAVNLNDVQKAWIESVAVPSTPNKRIYTLVLAAHAGVQRFEAPDENGQTGKQFVDGDEAMRAFVAFANYTIAKTEGGR